VTYNETTIRRFNDSFSFPTRIYKKDSIRLSLSKRSAIQKIRPQVLKACYWANVHVHTPTHLHARTQTPLKSFVSFWKQNRMKGERKEGKRAGWSMVLRSICHQRITSLSSFIEFCARTCTSLIYKHAKQVIMSSFFSLPVLLLVFFLVRTSLELQIYFTESLQSSRLTALVILCFHSSDASSGRSTGRTRV